MAIPINPLIIGELNYGLMINNILTGGGYNPDYRIVESPFTFTECLKQNCWDIIIADTVVNGFSAFAALKILKGSGLDIPCVVAAVEGDEDQAVALMRAGARDYLYKKGMNRLIVVVEREIREAAVRRESRKAKASLKDSEKRMADIINFLPDATFAVDKEGRVIVWNKAIEELTGVGASQVLGKDNYEYAAIFYGERYPIVIDRVLNQDIELPKNYLVFCQRHDVIVAESKINTVKGEKYVWLKATPLYDSKGSITGAIESIRDITHRYEAEKVTAESMENLKKTLEATVIALAMTAEKRDASTAGHQQRTTGLAVAIAKKMALDDKTVETIRIATILHDIGKISIPSEILNKAGQLTDLEKDLIKTHPLTGYEIAKMIPFEGPVAEIILQHHERLNGSGYPHGISGQDILLGARILAVADVFEAMVSHRPYRPALGAEKAIEEISKNSGILYDADVVEACLEIYRRGVGKNRNH